MIHKAAKHMNTWRSIRWRNM